MNDITETAAGATANGKVIIAGTGRAGTTVLVRALSKLGADTGFGGDERGTFVESARAGFERNPLAADAPRIVKNPAFSDRIGPLLDAGELAVEHVIVPMRDLEIATASRLRVSDYGARRGVPGGVFGTRKATDQRQVLADNFYQLVWACVRHDVPMTFLEFPRFAIDADYLHAAVGWLTPDRTVDEYRTVLGELVDESLITETPLSIDEQRKLRRRSLRYTIIGRPQAHLRARFGRAKRP